MSNRVKDQKLGRGRPSKYKNNAERKSARAQAARKRRAAMKEQGLKEVRRVVKAKTDAIPYSTIIDLSSLHNNKRD